MAKLTNMDVDGIQKQISEYDVLLSKIAELSSNEAIQIEQKWNASLVNNFNNNLNKDEDDNVSTRSEVIKEYEQRIARLNLDLKREKELRQVKYYRNDKKTNEIKRLHKEKDDLIDTCRKYETIIKDLEQKNMQLLNENQQLQNTVQIKISECKELSNIINSNATLRTQNKLGAIPPALQSKHIVRITELETEIEELKELIKSFELMSKKNSFSENAKDMLEKMSVLLLNKNTDPNFFSETQKEIIRSLFGDYATKTYKNRINELTDKLSKYQQDRVQVFKNCKSMVERCIE